MTDAQEPESQADIAARALAAKQRADAEAPAHAEQAAEGTSPAADQGMSSTPRENYAPSGAFDAEGNHPVVERSRKAR